MVEVFNKFIENYQTNHCKRTEFHIWSVILFLANFVLWKAFSVPIFLFNFLYICGVVVRNSRIPYKEGFLIKRLKLYYHI